MPDPNTAQNLERLILQAESRDQVREALNKNPRIVNAICPDGNTLLTTAALVGRTDIVQLLLDHGADVNGTDKFGNTALSFAVNDGNNAMRDVLLRRGADPDIKNIHGTSPRSLAQDQGLFDKAVESARAGMEQKTHSPASSAPSAKAPAPARR